MIKILLLRSLVGWFALFLSLNTTSAKDIEISTAELIFVDYDKTCTKAKEMLWGNDLCGPLMFVNPATKEIVTNTLATGLSKKGSLWQGMLPPNLPIANTSVNWDGKNWAMVMWPLPEDKKTRDQLVMHESWHRFERQNTLLVSADMPNHLASLEGRILLRLELHALAVAIADDGLSKDHALAAAFYRHKRYALTMGAKEQELALEFSEGFAEYVGMRMANWSDIDAHILEALKRGENIKSYVRSFAYYTGPAWGRLLEKVDPDWPKTRALKTDLSTLYLKKIGLSLPLILPEIERYDRIAIVEEETKRDEAKKIILADYLTRFVKGKTLILPQNGNMSFDPNKITPLMEHGTLYETMSLKSKWGSVTATKGLLISPNWGKATLEWKDTKTQGAVTTGPGWELVLNTGWKLVKANDGNMTIAK